MERKRDQVISFGCDRGALRNYPGRLARVRSVEPAGGPTPLKISIPEGHSFALQAPIAEGKVTRHDDPNFKMETLYYLNNASFTLSLKKEGAPATAEAVPVDVRFQACNDRLCLPPYTAHLTADLKRR